MTKKIKKVSLQTIIIIWALQTILPEAPLSDLRYESFAYMEKTVRETQIDSEYYYYNRFGMDKKDFVDAMNNVLQAKRKFEAGDNIRQLIETSVEQVKYPFNLFLKLKNEERQNDTVNMMCTCRELLSINTPYELLHYGEEYVSLYWKIRATSP